MTLTYTGIGGVDLRSLSLDAILDRQALSMGITKYLWKATENRHFTQTELDLLELVSNDYFRCSELLIKKWDEMFVL